MKSDNKNISQAPKELIPANRTFLIEEEDLCVHIIKTGFSQRKNYLVVYEDAYQQRLGETEMMSEIDIKNRFRITL
tara:strand:- start:2370 stop:2597 length:228 start_codon:yes stop_codon:yes gene_type:complete